MLRDIRELADQQEAYADELRRRWGGLLSYRYIGRRYASMDPRAVDDTVTLRRDVRNPTGRDVRRIEIVSEELKVGRQMGYSRAKIVDADRPDRVLALIEGQGVTIGIPPEGLAKMEVDPIEVVDSPELPPLWQVFGGRRRPDGHWALPELSAEVASPDAALHIGPQFVILETAAADAAGQLAGTDALQGLSVHVMFLARGKVGPFRVEAEAMAGRDGTLGARVVLHDEGADDKAITAGSYVFAGSR